MLPPSPADLSHGAHRHYEEFLAPLYSWTLGSFDARVAASEDLFRSLLVPAGCLGPRALDLGCGTGVQTLALSRLGYRVHGIDFSPVILREYKERTEAVGAEATVGDIAQLSVASGFVEDAGDHVRVTDLLHQREEGAPLMRVSSYLKLRVSPEGLARELAAASLTVRETRSLPGGVHVLFAVKES